MSRRPPPSGLTKDTSDRRTDSRGSPLSGLGSDITSVRLGDYPGIVRFIKQQPRIADTQEINRLLTRASVHKTAGESSLARTCVHHALALRKWRDLGPHEAGIYFESLAEDGEKTRAFMRDVTKVSAALPQDRAYAPTATEITQSQTPVFRENDGRPYYIDNQGNTCRPESNRQNPDRYRILSDPATDDRNIREHGRTLVRYDPELSNRIPQEIPDRISRHRPQGEPELPLESYFLPGEGIKDSVIQRDITRHLGATSSVEPYVNKDVSLRKRGQKRAHTFVG
jgi:hypothetical protein